MVAQRANPVERKYALLALVVSMACRESAGPAPGEFDLAAPANGAVGQPNNPILSWEASTGALSYTLTVDDDSDFSSPIFARNVGNVTSVPVTGLNYETVYYWRVIAYNAYGDIPADWSYSFTTLVPCGSTARMQVPLPCPTAIRPGNADNDVILVRSWPLEFPRAGSPSSLHYPSTWFSLCLVCR